VETRLQAAVPRVTLRQATPGPYAGAIAAARTCYSPRVVGAEEVTPAQRESIGPLTFDAGHHTVYQHAHFEFGLEGVSRQFVWSFLHSHPFYNSEQSSQRFVRLDEISAHVPEGLTIEARAVFEQAIIDAWQAYREITQLLRPETERLVGELRHLSPRASEARRRRIVREAEKKAIEVARYALPVAATTSMVHTISGIVLHRLYRMLHTGDTPRENARVVEAMVAAVRAVDAELFERIGKGPIPAEETVELRIPRAAGAAQATATRLEERLGGRVSVLVDWPAHAETTVADAVRAVVGSDLDDDEALRWLLDPARNRYRLETLQTTMHSPVGRALHHATYTFLKRLSHTADSQDQRHRMVPASRPLTTLTDTVRPDYVVPALVRERPQILEVFVRAMETAWAAKNLLLDMGVPAELALYVLPNARALRFYETGSLLYLIHKWVQRTCLNAQEEIYQASMEELGQVRAVHPRLTQSVGPPCVLRAGRATPICTEGLHFCGIPVWRTFPEVQRIL
jgi:thymidylate synthase ThyX